MQIWALRWSTERNLNCPRVHERVLQLTRMAKVASLTVAITVSKDDVKNCQIDWGQPTGPSQASSTKGFQYLQSRLREIWSTVVTRRKKRLQSPWKFLSGFGNFAFASAHFALPSQVSLEAYITGLPSLSAALSPFPFTYALLEVHTTNQDQT